MNLLNWLKLRIIIIESKFIDWIAMVTMSINHDRVRWRGIEESIRQEKEDEISIYKKLH